MQELCADFWPVIRLQSRNSFSFPGSWNHTRSHKPRIHLARPPAMHTKPGSYPKPNQEVLLLKSNILGPYDERWFLVYLANTYSVVLGRCFEFSCLSSHIVMYIASDKEFRQLNLKIEPQDFKIQRGRNRWTQTEDCVYWWCPMFPADRWKVTDPQHTKHISQRTRKSLPICGE